jgi:predicted RNase H-like nuclease (RuvC/YqgF family)
MDMANKEGKTETIKERAIYVYLPSIEMARVWKLRADKAGLSTSKFVVDRVEDSISKEEGEDTYLSRLQLVERLRKAEDELKSLREENRLLKKLVDNLDKELKRYRGKSFLEESFEGSRAFSRELIDLLKKGITLSGDEILANLNIELSDTDLVKSVNRQLEALETYGLVEFTGKGWRWKG